MRRLDLDKPAVRFLRHLPPKHARQIFSKIALLLKDPYPPDSKKLSGYPYWRVNSGEYRVVYSVLDETIAVRNDIYRRLERLDG